MNDGWMTEWHRWFAWHPVRIGDRTVWLTHTWRRCLWSFVDGDSYEFEYRALDDPPRLLARNGGSEAALVRGGPLRPAIDPAGRSSDIGEERGLPCPRSIELQAGADASGGAVALAFAGAAMDRVDAVARGPAQVRRDLR